MQKSVKDLCNNVDTSALIARPLTDWRSILSKECGVYVYGETYLAKRFDGINYKFCNRDVAKEILIDNLYALLRFKYFPKVSEEIDERISDIVHSFTANLKTTLKRVSFDKFSNQTSFVKYIPDYCVAFQNGVYDFKNDKWFFKYETIVVPQISNTIYLYDDEYVITWYLDYPFEPLPINISNTSLSDFVELMQNLTNDPKTRNYCFELMYNICHNQSNKFSLNRFEHLAQILGYSILQSFSQYFVFIIGSGQNGKNSLFDGCFTNRVVPRPAANSLDDIEQDRFITGSLENRAQNIFLETSPKTYTSSTMIKALTGSMYQTIESKGISKYSGIINCKFIFSGNDQNKIKFSDVTHGFKRRINMFEIFYTWDQQKRFMLRGDYYDTSFSDSLIELTSDVFNTTAYVYLAMYGLMIGTKNFTSNFSFTHNEWSMRFADVDLSLKDTAENYTAEKFASFLSEKDDAILKKDIFDVNKHTLQSSKTLASLGIEKSRDGVITMLSDPELRTAYFSEYDIYISLQLLKKCLRILDSQVSFNQKIKETFNQATYDKAVSNKLCVKCTFIDGKLKFIQ